MREETCELLIIQPALVHYRISTYNKIASLMTVKVIASIMDPDINDLNFNLSICQTIRFKGITWQVGVICEIFKRTPKALWIPADLNFISSIVATLFARILGIKVFLHGQGLIKKGKAGFIKKIGLRLWCYLSDSYVAYAEPCRKSLVDAGFSKEKITTIENRFEDSFSSVSDRKLCPDGVLFVGRLRPGCRIEWLLRAHQDYLAAFPGSSLTLHIIGSGPSFSEYRSKFSDRVIWYGRITDDSRIAEIAAGCRFAAYPGRAGLSVITYLGMGLPVIVAKEIAFHMGPEPHHVKSDVNGWTYQSDSFEDFFRCYVSAASLSTDPVYSNNARASYVQLHTHSYGAEMAALISKVLHES